MLIRADGQPHMAWALKDTQAGTICLSLVDAVEDAAKKLHHAQQIHCPHFGELELVRVHIILTEVRS